MNSFEETASEVWAELPPEARREEIVAMFGRALMDEYKRGKRHGDDDLRLSQQHCRELQRELDEARREISKAKMKLLDRTKSF